MQQVECFSADLFQRELQYTDEPLQVLRRLDDTSVFCAKSTTSHRTIALASDVPFSKVASAGSISWNGLGPELDYFGRGSSLG